MSYSPYAHTTATSSKLGLIKLGSGVGGNADGTLVSNATLLSLSKSSVGLGNVENTTLSTWGGSSNITTLGTVTVGSAPASDVYSWAKASTKPTYSKSEVGLGNVDNTADTNKSVSYAATARGLNRSDSAVDSYNVQSHWDGSYWYLKGYNSTTYHAGVRVAIADSAPASDVYAWAKASTKPSYTNSEVGLGNVGNYTVSQNMGTGDNVTFNIVYANQFLYQSDAALKNNIENITGSWDVLDKLRPVSFDWKNNQKSDYGFIAQELQEVLPNSVGSDGRSLGITPSAIIAHLVAAVKDLKSQVETLTKRLGD